MILIYSLNQGCIEKDVNITNNCINYNCCNQSYSWQSQIYAFPEGKEAGLIQMEKHADFTFTCQCGCGEESRLEDIMDLTDLLTVHNQLSCQLFGFVNSHQFGVCRVGF